MCKDIDFSCIDDFLNDEFDTDSEIQGMDELGNEVKNDEKNTENK